MVVFVKFFTLFFILQCSGVDLSSERPSSATKESSVAWEVPEKSQGTGKIRQNAESLDKKKKLSKKKKSNKISVVKKLSSQKKKSSEFEQEENLEPLPPAGSRLEILEGVKMIQLVEIDSNFLRTKLDEFTGESPVDIGGQTMSLGARNNEQGKLLARQYLKGQFEELGFQVREHAYESGVNFIAEKKGLYENRFLLLGAHYDTVATVGADDDASGVIASLAIAESIREKDLLYGLRIVLFDEEELGLLGSSAYVKKLMLDQEEDSLIGSIVLEMLGYDSDDNGAFHIVDCLQDPSNPTAGSAMLSDFLMKSVVTQGGILQRTDACTDRSDHTAFWQENLPAVVVSQDFFGGDNNPCYHDACDQTDRINFNYYENLTIMIGSAVSELLLQD
ncbi:MAG: M28 family peptidase [Oligoflexales bacterium]